MLESTLCWYSKHPHLNHDHNAENNKNILLIYDAGKRPGFLYPGNAVLVRGDQLDSCLGFGEIMELDTILLDLNAAERIDILVSQQANLGLVGLLRHTVYLL